MKAKVRVGGADKYCGKKPRPWGGKGFSTLVISVVCTYDPEKFPSYSGASVRLEYSREA